MFERFKKKSNRFVVMDINEYLIKAVVMNTKQIENAVIYQAPLKEGIFDGDVLVDEMAFYELMKELLDKWGLKRLDVRFFVPESTVMMKTFEHPDDVATENLKGFVEMELGRSIHLPYPQPLLDVYDFKQGDGEATLFAAPSEEIIKMAGLLDDLSLHPSVAEIRALASIRFFEEIKSIESARSYLIMEWSITGVSISIYSGGKVEFLRYQAIETERSNWMIDTKGEEFIYEYNGDADEYRGQLIDQIAEVDRILNFYRFSLYKGEKAVDEIVIFGDNPEMEYIYTEMAANLVTPVQYFDDIKVKKMHPNFKSRDIPLIGLIYREV
ncbi:pilus assembly protein PilM [Psychrobacillus sp. BL-248-WT-3]|uniref:type IV pilus biogenesis protein PilM n=1 Tax=Psychrobacillus sp. BL-248-WT-3 TaxID=2725306 RepID=UPI00146E0D93|nr:pilus assembly protein PilM [Psychrobacillus sp. BL-248-WT-3]NME06167.1 pilus assembly protein PilM [Psychrobacillus sp. BL-248-WT-3]